MSVKTPAILIFSFSPLARDPRVLRQIEIVNEVFPETRVITIGHGEKWSDTVTHLQLTKSAAPDQNPRFIFFGRSGEKKLDIKLGTFWSRFFAIWGAHKNFYWSIGRVKEGSLLIRDLISEFEIKCVIANDFDCMPLIMEHFDGDLVFLDSHEFTPDQSLSASLKNCFLRRHKKWLVQSSYLHPSNFSTVSYGIREAYLTEFGPRELSLWENVPSPKSPRFKNSSDSSIKLVHHGLGTRPRQIERMVDTLNELGDGFELHFYLVNLPEDYKQELVERQFAGQMVFHDPVPTKSISTELTQFDVGIFLHEPRSLNATHMLPNKFFEFVQAGLAVATGPALEMSKISLSRGFGIVSKDYEPASLAKEIKGLAPEKLKEKKMAARNYSKELDNLYRHEPFVSFLFEKMT